MRYSLPAIALSLVVGCVAAEPPVRYPAVAFEAEPTRWGVASGVTISGGYGSDIVIDPRDSTVFWLLTDRGPNTLTDVPGQLLFPMPDFTPAIAKFRLAGDSLRLVERKVLKSASGIGLSGRPNPPGQGGTGEVGVDPSGTTIPFDAEGLDSEGLAVAPDGTFWVSDEYGPHIVHFDADGRTLERINPFGSGDGSRALPLVLARRRPNRGMEGLAITPDGKKLIGVMQGPLDNPDATVGRASDVNRILEIDLATGATRQFVYEVDAVGNYVNEVHAITASTFLVIERDSHYQGGEPPAISKRIYRIDIAGATDVSDPANSPGGRLFGGKVLEALTRAERAAQGVVPVAKSLAYDLLTLPGGYPHDKLEGVTMVGRALLVVSNDDDFGIVDGGRGTFIEKLLPATQRRDQLAVYFIRLAAPLP